MVIDKITLEDLGIFHRDQQYSLLGKLNFCKTQGGVAYLQHILMHPHSNIDKILAVQQTLAFLMKHLDKWPNSINNGAITVIERFYDSQIDTPPDNPNTINSFVYKLLHKHDFSLIKFSALQLALFVQGLRNLITDTAVENEKLPTIIQVYFDTIDAYANSNAMLAVLPPFSNEKELSAITLLSLGSFCFKKYKHEIENLLDIYYQLEAYYSLAQSVKQYQLHFPAFDITKPYASIEAKGLYHLMLPTPTAYDIRMDDNHNFIFLTGANMAGKSTLIRSVGCAIYLAHIGMAIPAESLRIGLFDGMLTNINVTDNIAKGESYFYNEVQRIKNTVTKISDGKKWLVLIDELFKGTNVQDAMRCSLAVIKGLVKLKQNAFILSTHLYEIGEELKVFNNINFKYFETTVENNELSFSYQIKEGISNDRLGYFILQREGVVDMLQKLH
jgi:DNA mismatch repair protein MutS